MRLRHTLLLCTALFQGPAFANTPPTVSPPVVQRQTLGAKLRDGYLAAAGGNYVTNAPWFACVSGNNSIAPVVCSAWVASMAFVQGQVVANSGHLYVAIVAGTSASSGGPTQTTNVPTTDGSVTWLYFGEPRVAANDAQAPTVSTATGTAPFSGAVYWNLQGFSQLYTSLGVTYSGAYGSYFLTPTTFDLKASTPTSYGAMSCANVTDSKFAISVSNTDQTYSIVINDRLLSVQPNTFITGNPNEVVVDFSATSGLATRKVCLLGNKAAMPHYGGIFTTASGSVAPISAPNVNAVMIYDSYDGGSNYGPYSGYSVFSQQLAALMGWSVSSMGTGGTGPQNPGASYYNYNARVADAKNASLVAASNVVISNVSTNDASCNGTISATCPIGSETTAIQNLLTAERALAPTALLVEVGPAPLNPGSPTYAQTAALDTLGAAAVASWNDPAPSGLKCYIPWASLTPPTLFPASYQSGVPSGLPATAALINTADGVHPTDLGTTAMARWLAQQIAAKCFPTVN